MDERDTTGDVANDDVVPFESTEDVHITVNHQHSAQGAPTVEARGDDDDANDEEMALLQAPVPVGVASKKETAARSDVAAVERGDHHRDDDDPASANKAKSWADPVETFTPKDGEASNEEHAAIGKTSEPTEKKKKPSIAVVASSPQIQKEDGETWETKLRRYLPHITDKPRNNVRSRAVLIGVYVVAAAVICAILVLVLVAPSTGSWSSTFSAPPPPSIFIGSDIRPFSMQLKDPQGQSAQGLECVALFVPVQPLDVLPTALGQSMLSRTVVCLESIVFPSQLHDDDDTYFCVTGGCTATSDENGLALFENCTMEQGGSSVYMVLGLVQSRSDIPAAISWTSTSVDVRSITVSPTAPLGTTGTLSTSSSFNFTVAATVASNAESPVIALSAGLVTLSLDSTKGYTDWAPFGVTDGVVDKDAHIRNAVSSTVDIVKLSSTTAVATFQFINVQLLAANSRAIFLGISVGDLIMPISSLDTLNTNGQSPETIACPFTVVTTVSSILVAPAVGSPLAAASPAIVEGAAFSLSVTVKNSSNKIVPNKRVYLTVTPSAANPSTPSDFHPMTNPKFVVNDIASTDITTGVANFRNSFFSVSGSIGFYDIEMIVDGVRGTWPNGKLKITVQVLTSVSSGTIAAGAFPTDIAVGDTWENLPSIRIFSAANLPIPGKVARIQSRLPNEAGIVGYATKADDSGVSYFTSVRIGFAMNEQNYDFDIVVDGVVIATGSVDVYYSSDADPSDCSHVNFTSLPTVPMFGPGYTFQFTALAYDGTPVDALLNQVPNPDDAATDMSADMTFDTDDNGDATFDVTVDSLGTSYSRLEVQCVLNSGEYLPFTSGAVVVLSSRVSSVAATVSGSTITVNPTVPDWSPVSGSSPIKIDLALLGYPTYAYFYDVKGETAPSASAADISSAADLPAVLDISPGTASGHYLLAITVDGVTLPPVFTFTVAPTPGILLTIDTSAFTAGGTVFLAQQPSIQVSDAGGTGLPGYIVYALLLFRNASLHAAAPVEVQTVEDLSALSAGFVARISGTDRFAESDLSDSTGLASFSSLTLLGKKRGLEISLRYCVGSDQSSSGRTCVDEPFFYNGAAEIQTNASVKTVQRSPGNKFDPITICETKNKAPALVCSAYVTEGNNKSAIVTSSILLFFDEDGLPLTRPVYFTGPRASCATLYLGLSTTALPGAYNLVFPCSGDSLAMLLTVTTTPISLQFVVQPDGAPLQVNTMSSLELSVHSAGVLRNAAVQITLTRPLADCEYLGCGVFTDSSVTVARTDKVGEVRLHFALKAADDGLFDITASILDPLAKSATLSYMLDMASGLSAVGGASRHATFNLLSTPATLPIFTSVLDAVSGVQIVGVKDESAVADGLLASYIGIAPASAVTDVAPVDVINPVASIRIVREGSYAFTLASKIAGVAGSATSSSIGAAQAALVQLLDVNGAPVPNASVEVTTMPFDGSSKLKVTSTLMKSDSNGLCSIYPLTLKTSVAGTYQLLYTSNGGAGILSARFVVKKGSVLSLKDAMMYTAFIVVGFLTPMLAATVPHSKPAYAIVGAIASIVFTVVVIVGGQAFGSDLFAGNKFVKGYFIFVYVVTAFFCVLCVGMSFLYLVSHLSKKRSLRFMNDEGKANRLFQYVFWMTNRRIENQRKEDNDLIANAKTDKEREKLIATLRPPPSAENPLGRPPLRYDPQLDPTFFPIDFLAVIGVTLIMLVVMSLILFYMYDNINDTMVGLVQTLPTIPDDPHQEEINTYFVSLIATVCEMIAQHFPQYAVLAKLGTALSSTNVIALVSSVGGIALQFVQRFPVIFGISFALGMLSSIGNLAGTIVVVKLIAGRSRRGELAVNRPLFQCQSYIGLHVFHFVAGFVIIFVISLLIATILALDAIRNPIIAKVLVIALGLLGLSLVFNILEKTVVKLILFSDNWTVVRSELFSFWDIFAFITGLFSGIAQTIARLVTGIVMLFALFPKLDISIYPSMMVNGDPGHGSFLAVIDAEAKNSNGFYLLFSTFLIAEQEIKRRRIRLLEEFAEETSRDVEEEEAMANAVAKDMCENFFEEKKNLSPAVINLSRMYVRFVCGFSASDCAAWAVEDKDLRYPCFKERILYRRYSSRVVNRFWLGMLLTLNPSLRFMRKGYRAAETARLDAAAASQRSAGNGMKPANPGEKYL